MQLGLVPNIKRSSISAYSEQGIKIGGRWYKQNLLLTADKVYADWQTGEVGELSYLGLKPILSDSPEVLILGTGKQLIFPSPRLYAELANLGTGLEVMDTKAACRTFNILLSEDRNVVAALYVES